MTKAVAGKDLSPNTVDSHRWAVSVLTSTIGSKRVKTLRPEEVETVFLRLATHGREPSTLR